MSMMLKYFLLQHFFFCWFCLPADVTRYISSVENSLLVLWRAFMLFNEKEHFTAYFSENNNSINWSL